MSDQKEAKKTINIEETLKELNLAKEKLRSLLSMLAEIDILENYKDYDHVEKDLHDHILAVKDPYNVLQKEKKEHPEKFEDEEEEEEN